MSHKPPADVCPKPSEIPSLPTMPHSSPLYLASVWACDSPQQSLAMLQGDLEGYVYQRDGHPNADMLAAKLRQLHGAEQAKIASCGMAAIATVVLSQLRAGDHMVVSDQLYGRSLELLADEALRLGLDCDVVDTCDLAAVSSAISAKTKLIAAETISNPLVRVADIRSLAEISHACGAKLLIDNTFASPIVCRPLEHGADLIVESISKSINGHSDVMLGAVLGSTSDWGNVARMASIWGLASSPFDCWLAARGLMTLHLRMKAACENAQAVAEFLTRQSPAVGQVRYPGLDSHPDHALATRQFGEQYGGIVTFDLAGGMQAAEAFIRRLSPSIPFCPSLGEVSTTLTHPATTTHRNQTPEQQAALGISAGTIRLSVGTESSEGICAAIKEGLG